MSLTSSDYLNYMEIKLEINCQLLPIYIDQTLRPVAAGVASVGSLCGLLQCPEANSLSGCHPYLLSDGMWQTQVAAKFCSNPSNLGAKISGCAIYQAKC